MSNLSLIFSLVACCINYCFFFCWLFFSKELVNTSGLRVRPQEAETSDVSLGRDHSSSWSRFLAFSMFWATVRKKKTLTWIKATDRETKHLVNKGHCCLVLMELFQNKGRCGWRRCRSRQDFHRHRPDVCVKRLNSDWNVLTQTNWGRVMGEGGGGGVSDES